MLFCIKLNLLLLRIEPQPEDFILSELPYIMQSQHSVCTRQLYRSSLLYKRVDSKQYRTLLTEDPIQIVQQLFYFLCLSSSEIELRANLQHVPSLISSVCFNGMLKAFSGFSTTSYSTLVPAPLRFRNSGAYHSRLVVKAS